MRRGSDPVEANPIPAVAVGSDPPDQEERDSRHRKRRPARPHLHHRARRHHDGKRHQNRELTVIVEVRPGLPVGIGRPQQADGKIGTEWLRPPSEEEPRHGQQRRGEEGSPVTLHENRVEERRGSKRIHRVHGEKSERVVEIATAQKQVGPERQRRAGKNRGGDEEHERASLASMSEQQQHGDGSRYDGLLEREGSDEEQSREHRPGANAQLERVPACEGQRQCWHLGAVSKEVGQRGRVHDQHQNRRETGEQPASEAVVGVSRDEKQEEQGGEIGEHPTGDEQGLEIVRKEATHQPRRHVRHRVVDTNQKRESTHLGIDELAPRQRSDSVDDVELGVAGGIGPEDVGEAVVEDAQAVRRRQDQDRGEEDPSGPRRPKRRSRLRGLGFQGAPRSGLRV